MDIYKQPEIPIMGISTAFRNAMNIIAQIANCDAITLINGETGTGKELAAKSIHFLSARSNYPFIPVNCAAIPDSLFESELFGHTKGAFTDAKDFQRGLIQQAEGGTLFLDEIECLSIKGQAVLLRFLQDLSYRPVGGQMCTANVRIIVASNCDLLAMAKSGEFRMDLYYRLALLTVTMPSLREREGDAEFLASYFVEKAMKRFGVTAKTMHAETLSWFRRYDWPGNVRELENLIYREILLSQNNDPQLLIDPPSVLKANRRSRPDRRQEAILNLTYEHAKKRILKDFEQQYLHNLLNSTKGNISAAARLAGKERRSFGRLLQKNAIDKIDFCV